MEYEAASWIGESGTVYDHFIYPLDAEIPSRHGTYVYAYCNAEGVWLPVYMGQGDLAERCTSDSDLMQRIVDKGATHVHLRLNASEEERRFELDDLLRQYKNAYVPYGCHEHGPPT